MPGWFNRCPEQSRCPRFNGDVVDTPAAYPENFFGDTTVSDYGEIAATPVQMVRSSQSVERNRDDRGESG